MHRVLAVGIQEHLGIALTRLVQQESDDLSIRETPDMEQALQVLEAGEHYQLIIACLNSHDLRALANVQRLREHYSDTMMLAMFDVGTESLNAQATIRRILATFRASHPSRNPLIDERPLSSPPAHPARRASDRIGEEPVAHHLTSRQIEVLYLLKEGKSNKEIARLLHLSEGTVKVHCMAIFRALGVTNRTQAAIAAAVSPGG